MEATDAQSYLAFGPVPSRRLGASLGVNNIPAKTCTYSCVYCQLGSTIETTSSRREFFPVGDIVQAVENKVAQVRGKQGTIDYITFVPDGEPTLDLNLGREIDALKHLGIKIAVITNSSLMWDPAVRKDLGKADWVSVKVDTVEESVWNRINRPSSNLRLREILEGIAVFSKEYNGFLATESMIVSGINDSDGTLEKTSEFIGKLKPDISYISIPTRPPAEDWVFPPDEESIVNAYQIFKGHVDRVELLTGYEGDLFYSTGDIRQDILGIISVHPMRKDAMTKLLHRAGENFKVMERMLEDGSAVEVEYQGNTYYVRRRPGKEQH